MRLSAFDAPHIRHGEATRVLMGDVILTMAILYMMAGYYYGLRAVLLGLTGIGAAVASDILCVLAAGKRVNLRDYSAVVTGMMLPLFMPASIDYWIVAVAAMFAIVVAKHPFGGTGHNIFNPAAAGFSFVAICFGSKLYTYPPPLTHLPISGEISFQSAVSPGFTLDVGGIPNFDIADMALYGNFPGPMGATNILVILACLLYLVSRNTVNWKVPICFYATTAAYAWAFPRVGGGLTMGDATRLDSVIFEMMSGMLLLGGMLMLGDPVTTPRRNAAKVAYAVASGIIVMLFRVYGGFEEELPFAILLMNATVWGFDMAAERWASLLRRKRHDRIVGQALQKKA